ncbi:hypothetical protein LAD12857_03330 [Lacrimispora amygdalina]|uniref:Uncharacterized protein n=1 Tax=Lacrimispora amygdalina TaxID=253257 RepID=A0A3E2N496_9FIRM|nr:hypothetical protein [Clostridium indicum]RFZ75803.1 hypothetical protein DS742_27170 [Clostridium indicum]
MTKRLNYYVIMMLMGGIVWLEGSIRFISRIFTDIIILLPPLPVAVHYLIRSFLEIAVIYGEALLLLFILSDWRSKRDGQWQGYKKILYLYLIIGVILEKIIIYIFHNLISFFIESYPIAVTIFMAFKIVTVFFMVIIVMKMSLKNKSQALCIDKTSLKHFIAGAVVTIGFAVLCSFKEWQDYQIFMSDMDTYGFFSQMTAPTPVYTIFNQWMVPYMVRICAVLLFMGEGKQEEALCSGNFNIS